MPDNGDVPAEVLERFDKLKRDGEEHLYSIASDIDARAMYGERWLFVTNQRLLVLSEDGDGAAPVEVPMEEVTDAEAEVLVGNGVLRVTANGHTIELLRYSNTLASDFAKLARAVAAYAKDGKELNPEALREVDDKKRCAKCGRVLPIWTDICLACMKRSRTLGRMMRLLLPYKWRVVTASLLTLCGTGVHLVQPYLVRPFTNQAMLGQPRVKGDPLLTIDERIQWAVMLVLVWIGLQLLQTALTMVRGVIVAWLGGRVTLDVRSKLYDALQRLTLRNHDRKETGRLISRMTNDSERLQHFIIDFSQEMANELLLLVGVGIMIFVIDWRLASWVVIPATLILVSTWWFGNKIHTIYHQLWRRWARMTARVSDALSGVRVVKAFAQEDCEIDKFDGANLNLFSGHYRAERLWALFFPVVAALTFAGVMIVRYSGGLQVIHDEMDLGGLTAFIMYLMMFYTPIRYLTRINNYAQRAMTAAERVFEIMDSEHEDYDAPESMPMSRIEGRVEFKNVTFGYIVHEPVLHDIDMDVKPGEMVGLVGHSGAGKSTTINLICRFYDVDEGQILIDGEDIRNVKLEDLRHQLGVVPQESFLFVGSLAENIAYAKPDATREEIMRAARVANAHDFIMRMPDGYDTQVGERGTRISVGERQRIAIARAILHDPRILILDEATASVDTETEKQIQEALARLVKGRTTFAIAHRLSTLRNADRLVVLEKGKLVEIGTHDELLEKKGTYHKLVQMQSDISKMKAVGG
ncbi:MAG: ABC transporter ATP-binding protein [Armatimonadota bacterium]